MVNVRSRVYELSRLNEIFFSMLAPCLQVVLSEIKMAYNLELKDYVHLELLSSTLQRWSNAQPDVFIISQEGDTINTQR